MLCGAGVSVNGHTRRGDTGWYRALATGEIKHVRVLGSALGVASVIEIDPGALLLLAVGVKVPPATRIWRVPCPKLTRALLRLRRQATRGSE